MKRIHKLLWWALYVTPLILCAYYFGGKILRNVLIDQLNQQLNVQAKVYSININGLRTFPQLGIELTNVRINESTKHYHKHLLQARKVVVVFNALKLITGKNEIDRVELNGGAARLYTNKKGETNFEIFKPTESTSENDIQIDLKKVQLTDFRLVYLDEKENQSFNFKTNQLLFSGKFDKERFTLKTSGDALFDHLMLGGTDYILGKRCKVGLVLDVNQKIKAYHIEKGSIALDELELDITGDVLMVEDTPDLDIKLSGSNINVQSILSILPNSIGYNLRELRSNGDIQVKGEVVGRFEENKWPKIDINFGFNDASIDWKQKDFSVEKVNLSGALSNLNSDKTTDLNLTLDIAEILLDKSSIKGNVSVQRLNTPNIDFTLKGLLDLGDIKGLLVEEKADKMFGRCLFNLKGGIPYDDKNDQPDFMASTVDGDIELRDIDYNHEGEKLIANLTAKTRVKGNNLTGVSIDGELWHNDVHFTGALNNWQGYLANNQRLEIEGDLKSKFINLNFTSSEEPDEELQEAEETSINFGFDAKVNMDIDTFTWGMVTAGKLTGKLGWMYNKLVFNNLNFNAWQGRNELNGTLEETNEKFLLTAISHSENVHIQRLLKDFDNFGQTEFTPEILQGTLTTTINLNMEFDRFFEVIEEEVRCLAEVKITDGRLKDYEPMQSLSSFVELEDLQDIRFAEINNTIEIGNREIYIPTMEVKSNAMNLEIGGSHSFDNYMNYRMKIRVTELLANKSGWVKRKKERQLEDEKGGGLSAYILMVGPPDDLKIKYDKKAVKNLIKEEVKKERKEFFKELKREIKREKTPSENTKKVQWDE